VRAVGLLPTLWIATTLVGIGCGNGARTMDDAGASGSARARASGAPSGAVAPAALAITDAGADAADAAVRPPLPRVRTLDVPEETKSPLPKAGEWNDVVRRDIAARAEYSCTLQRLREWHRIQCDCSNATVKLVTGTRDGVLLWAIPERAELIFPVRRGDRRVLEVRPNPKMVSFGGPYGGMGQQDGGPPLVLSETWLEGEAPTLVMQ
jgi:hypothetical protein